VFFLGHYVPFSGYKSSDNADNVTKLMANIPLARTRCYDGRTVTRIDDPSAGSLIELLSSRKIEAVVKIRANLWTMKNRAKIIFYNHRLFSPFVHYFTLFHDHGDLFPSIERLLRLPCRSRHGNR